MTLKATSTAQYTSYAVDGPTPTGTGFHTVSTTTLFTIARPSEVVAGDLIVVGISYNFDADESLASSGQHWNGLDAGWQATPNLSSKNIQVYWRIAGASEPSTYRFEVRNIFNNALVSAYANMILGVWDGLTDVSFLPIAAGHNRLQTSSSINHTTPPAVVDLDTVTQTGTETTPNGGIAVYFWSVWSGIENFDGTIGTEGNPAYPASTPYNTTAVQPTATQHEQIHYEGLPWYSDGSNHSPSTSTLVENRMLTMASETFSSGAVPPGEVALTWQHAGAEAGYAEAVVVYRLILRALIDTPYWGINAFPL